MTAARQVIMSNADFLPKPDMSPKKHLRFPLVTDPRSREFLERLDLSPAREVLFGRAADWLETPTVYNRLQAVTSAFPRNLELLHRIGGEKEPTLHAKHVKAQELADRTIELIRPLRDVSLSEADRFDNEAQAIFQETFRFDPERAIYLPRIFQLLDRWNADPEGAIKIREAATGDKDIISILKNEKPYVHGVNPELTKNLVNEGTRLFAPQAVEMIAKADKLRDMAANHDQAIKSVRASFGSAEMAREARASRDDINE